MPILEEIDLPVFASRAGLKLSYSLNHFKLSPKDLICADFGCNLGGFTDCLLQNGAAKVYSVDTSKNCIAWKLRNDPRIIVLERVNAMHIKLPDRVDLIVSDVAWTRQEKILPAIYRNLKPGGRSITLIKPHYEARRQELFKGKVKEEFLEEILQRVRLNFKENNFELLNLTKSPITGKSGKNIEYLALLKKGLII